METALLVIDVQKDYFPGGKMELIGSVEASNKIKNIIESFRNRREPIIHVQHIAAKPDATFFLPGTEGMKFHENSLPGQYEKVIRKNFLTASEAQTLKPIAKTMG